MSRYTVFADVAGRVSQDASGGNRMTAAAVALSTDTAHFLRETIRPLPKWRDSTLADVEVIVQVLEKNAASVAVASMTKDPEKWPAFWSASKPLQDAIVAQDRKPAGFTKPANVALFSLFCYAFAMATGHAIRASRGSRILDSRGLELVERTIVCDSDIQGEENIAVFKSLWNRSDVRQPLMEQAGFRIVTKNVIVTTEQDEPLLMLADYVAGIGHSALIENPGRLSLPLRREESQPLLERLNRTGKLVLIDKPFDVDYLDVFGEALLAAASNHTA